MDPKDKQVIDRLRHDIIYHDVQYYKHDNPVISDPEYDSLIREFGWYQDKYPKLSLPIGVSGGNVAHRYKMLSLRSVNTVEDLHELLNPKYTYSVELKMDGLAVELQYVDATLAIGSTRGDGVFGEDITENLLLVGNVPHTIKDGASETISGEIILDKNKFTLVNNIRRKAGKSIYSNCRNAAAGIIRSIHQQDMIKYLTFVPYDVTAIGINHTSDVQEWIKNLFGDMIANTVNITDGATSLEDLKTIIKLTQSYRTALQFDIDGIVFKVDDFHAREELGSSSKHPHWAIAYKFEASNTTTKLVDVAFQVGRTGIIAPVGIVEEVILLGKKVTRASLHNANKIMENNILLNDRVLIELANDVVPAIIKSIPEVRTGEERPILFPVECPCCGGILIDLQNKTVCENLKCTDQIVNTLSFMCSRAVLGIKGLGISTIASLVNEYEWFTDILGVYNQSPTELIPITGKKRSRKILKEIDRVRKITLAQFFQLMNVDNVSIGIATSLAQHFNSLELLLSSFNELEKAKIPNLPIQVRTDMLRKLRSKQFRMFSMTLLSLSHVKVLDMVYIKPTDIKVVFSGKFEQLSRIDFEHMTKTAGIQVTKSISNKVNYLVAGEKASEKKLSQAAERGISIISEDQMHKIINSR